MWLSLRWLNVDIRLYIVIIVSTDPGEEASVTYWNQLVWMKCSQCEVFITGKFDCGVISVWLEYISHNGDGLRGDYIYGVSWPLPNITGVSFKIHNGFG